MAEELTTLHTTTVEGEWLRQLLVDLPVVEKPIPAILMNKDNQTLIIKINNSKDNINIVSDYIQTSKNSAKGL